MSAPVKGSISAAAWALRSLPPSLSVLSLSLPPSFIPSLLPLQPRLINHTPICSTNRFAPLCLALLPPPHFFSLSPLFPCSLPPSQPLLPLLQPAVARQLSGGGGAELSEPKRERERAREKRGEDRRGGGGGRVGRRLATKSPAGCVC